MPFYINKLPDGSPLPEKGKEFMLIQMANAHLTPTPTEFIPDLVCIIYDEDEQNEKAVYCFSEGEMNYHLVNNDHKKIWLVVPDAQQLVES